MVHARLVGVGGIQLALDLKGISTSIFIDLKGIS